MICRAGESGQHGHRLEEKETQTYAFLLLFNKYCNGFTMAAVHSCCEEVDQSLEVTLVV